jgi:hypothetical protein
MALIATENGGKEFTPAPEGLHPAVCVDIVDMGEVENKFKPGTKQHKCRIVWQIAETDPDNEDKRFIVSGFYTVSLNEKANLRKDLENWRGRKFTSEELKGFDLEKLIGVNCQINVIHYQKPGGPTYANVETIVPIGKGMARMVPTDYVRVQDRPKDGLVSKPNPGESPNDDDVPF